jgi:uncharacterized protein YjiS (DUF1127 family)
MSVIPGVEPPDMPAPAAGKLLPGTQKEPAMLIMTFVAKLLATKTLNAATRPVAIAFSVAARQVKNLVRSRRNRSQVRLLSELTPRDLKDIGLLPSDVTGALAVRWRDDPSKVLVTRRPVPASLQSGFRHHAVVRQTPDAPVCDDICLPRSA